MILAACPDRTACAARRDRRVLGRGVLEITTPPAREAKDAAADHRSFDQLGPLSCLTGAMPVFRYDLPLAKPPRCQT